MSVHSIDHADDVISDPAYKGYHIDDAGEVTEFYDHRDEDPTPSSIPNSSIYRQPVVATNGVVQPAVPPQRRRNVVRYRDAGCCSGCVSLLTMIGTLPFATGLAFFCSWLGTALFIAGSWKAMDDSIALFAKHGPRDGNPATDPAPEYLAAPGEFSPNYILLNPNDLGNRVPQVFAEIKHAFYGIIPFIFFYTIIVVVDNLNVAKSLKKKTRNCKTSSAGICATAGLIACTYILILAWVFFICFTTLGVYYYRVVMLRCFDMRDRGYSDGVFPSICIDLVQFGLIMFQNTFDEGFGKICGPGDPSMRTVGNLADYCNGYYPIYEFMLMAFSGCLLNIIAMVNFLMILSSNYGRLTRRLPARRMNVEDDVVATTAPSHTAYMTSPAASRMAPSTTAGPPPYITGTRDHAYESGFRGRRPSRDELAFRGRRASKDIELDYLIDDDSTTPSRYREKDSNVGVDYYYKDRRH